MLNIIVCIKVVIDPEALREEIAVLKKEGITVHNRLFISLAAHVILPYHRYLDRLKEKESRKIGTTGKGIGPTYSDKVARAGIRVADFLDSKTFFELLEANIRDKKLLLERDFVLSNLTAYFWRCGGKFSFKVIN